jgi:hypothetical protein
MDNLGYDLTQGNAPILAEAQNIRECASEMASGPDQGNGIGNHVVHGIEHQRLPAPPEKSDPTVCI